TIEQLFPVLAGIIDAPGKGTRYQIHVDAADGLLYAGEPGVPLTWMDAKIGDWGGTPRTGESVGSNALWVNAVKTQAGFASELGQGAVHYRELAAAALKGFGRFWNGERGCCYDVIDVPGVGNDPVLRPNQIFAVALPVSPLSNEQQRRVVDICAERLL